MERALHAIISSSEWSTWQITCHIHEHKILKLTSFMQWQPHTAQGNWVNDVPTRHDLATRKRPEQRSAQCSHQKKMPSESATQRWRVLQPLLRPNSSCNVTAHHQARNLRGCSTQSTLASCWSCHASALLSAMDLVRLSVRVRADRCALVQLARETKKPAGLENIPWARLGGAICPRVLQIIGRTPKGSYSPPLQVVRKHLLGTPHLRTLFSEPSGKPVWEALSKNPS